MRAAMMAPTWTDDPRERAPAAPGKIGQEPVRTCVVCRTAGPARRMLRLRERGGGVRIEAAVRGGRGAWVCVRRDCLAGVEVRSLSRALGHPVVMPPADQWIEWVAQRAAQRVFEVLGLARRQGVLIVGQDRLAGEESRCTVVAHDASTRSRDAAGDDAWVFGDTQELSRATGLNGVAILGIHPGSLAQQAAYWLSVWYESRARGPGGGGAGA